MKRSRRLHLDRWAYGWPLLSSLLLFSAFLSDRFSAIVFVALLPYIWFLRFEATKKHPQLVLPTWLMGFAFILLTIGWLTATNTQGWLQLPSARLQVVIFCVWVAMGLVLSAGFVLLGWILQFLAGRVTVQQLVLIVLPISWAICEFLRSWLFSVASYGRGASLGPYWNFGVLGFAATATPLGYISRFVGLYGMTMLAIVINGLLFELILHKYRLTLIGFGAIAVLAVFSYLSGRPSTQTMRVGTVQLDSADNDYDQALAARIQQTASFRPKGVDLLALPEYSYFFEEGTAKQQSAVIQAAFPSGRGTLAYSRKGPERLGRPTNQVVVATAQRRIIATQEKTFLIPTGEYLPWVVSHSLQLVGQGPMVSYFNETIAVAKSPVSERPVTVNGRTIGVLACSGVIAPEPYRQLTRDGAQILINTASLNQFRTAKWYQPQSRQFAHFQAVANNRPFVQAARGGYSFILDHNGKTLVDFRQQGLQAGAAQVQLARGRTLYSIVGEWTLVAGGLGLLGIAYKSRQ